MTKGRNIALLLLWLAGLVIFLHEVIPHHHHTHSAFIHHYSAGHEACDHSEDHSGPADDCSTHCHAFNDITVERQTPIDFSRPEFSFDPDLFLPINLISGYVEAEESFCYVYFADSSGPELFLISVAPHRGPPFA